MHRSIALFLVAAALACTSPAALACSCLRVADRSFMTSAPKKPLVVHARVERHVLKQGDIHLAMDLKVVKVLQGSASEGSLRVFGDNGILCRPYVMKFPENSEWVFALDPSGKDWAIGGCRDNWLRVEGGRRVHGNISGQSISEVDVDELGAMLKQPPAAGSTETGR